jgi:RNA polymerase sigma-70 factor (ECF subfamily)
VRNANLDPKACQLPTANCQPAVTLIHLVPEGVVSGHGDDVNVGELQRLADEDLMPLVERKDPNAFEILYDRHGGPAYSLAYRIVGDRAAAEDVTQEAFLSAWRSGARYDRARGSVRTWLLGVVRNRAIDALRRDAARPPALSLDMEPPSREPAAGELTDVEALRQEAAREVRGALSQLPGDQLKVIQLAYFGGLSQSEIAEALGMPLGTVKGRMRLAMEKMRAKLAEGV